MLPETSETRIWITMTPLVAWGFLGAGIVVLGIAVLLASRSVRRLRSWSRVDGTVTGNDKQEITFRRGHNSNRWAFFPEIAFTTADGRRTSFRSRGGGNRAIPIGAVVPVLYDPADPRNAMIAQFGSMWGWALFVSVFSLPFLFEGVWGLLQQ
jgi:hypothetical protein